MYALRETRIVLQLKFLFKIRPVIGTERRYR